MKFSLGGNQGLNVIIRLATRGSARFVPNGGTSRLTHRDYATDTANNGLVYDARPISTTTFGRRKVVGQQVLPLRHAV